MMQATPLKATPSAAAAGHFIRSMEKFLALACTRLPDDVVRRLRELRGQEESAMQRIIYDSYFENFTRAGELSRPICQDTGILHFYARAGTAFPHLGLVETGLTEAVRRATASVPLRPNAIEFFTERNTGDNTAPHVPWLHWELVPDWDGLDVTAYFSGGGCSLPGSARVYKPSDGYGAVVRHVFETVSGLGVNACPPLVVGVGLANNVESAAALSKKACLRPLGAVNPHSRGAELERRLLAGLNNLGLGAQGLPGNAIALAVHIESAARHTATLACGVNVSCYVHRRGTISFAADLSHETPAYAEADGWQ